MSTGVPRFVTPKRTQSSGSLSMQRTRSYTAWPTSFIFSSSVWFLCEPRPNTTVMSSSGIPASESSSRTAGSTSKLGSGLEMSLVTMTTFWLGFAIFLSGLLPMGRDSA